MEKIKVDQTIYKVVTFCKSTGMIKSSGTTMFPHLLETNETGILLDLEADVINDYVFENQIKFKGIAPSIHHRFNFVNKTWELNNEKAWDAVRAQRDSLLTACDWVTLSDVSLSESKMTKWIQYRQALRDVTNQADPLAIVWPIR